MAATSDHHRCCGEALEHLLRKLAPETQVSIWLDNSGLLTTSFQFVKDGLAAFSGNQLDTGIVYIPVCDLKAVRIAAEMTPDVGSAAEPADGAGSGS